MTAPSDPLKDTSPFSDTWVAVMDRLGAYVYIKDRSGRYLYANAAVCALYGAAPEQVIGGFDAQFIDLARSPRLLANDRAVLDQGEALHDEEEIVLLHSGARCGFWTTKVPVRDARGQVVAVCGLSTDLTQHNWAADHLIERNHLLSTVLANIDAYIYLKDHTGRYLYANEKVLQLYGRSAGEVIGRHDQDLQGPAVAERLKAMDALVLSTMARQACEEILVDLEGQEHHYWSIKLPLERPGQPPCLIGFSTEITELLHLRQTLDRHFVTDVATDPRDADLCAGVIALAHKLGLKVVAEGVETEAQRQALLARECDLFQGYLFSRPLPAAQVVDYLLARPQGAPSR